MALLDGSPIAFPAGKLFKFLQISCSECQTSRLNLMFTHTNAASYFWSGITQPLIKGFHRTFAFMLFCSPNIIRNGRVFLGKLVLSDAFMSASLDSKTLVYSFVAISMPRI